MQPTKRQAASGSLAASPVLVSSPSSSSPGPPPPNTSHGRCNRLSKKRHPTQRGRLSSGGASTTHKSGGKETGAPASAASPSKRRSTRRGQRSTHANTKKEEVACETAGTTAPATTEMPDLPSLSATPTPAPKDNTGSNTNNNTGETVLQLSKADEKGKSRARKPPKSRSKNMKGVTASLSAKRLRYSDAVISTGAVKWPRSPPPPASSALQLPSSCHRSNNKNHSSSVQVISRTTDAPSLQQQQQQQQQSSTATPAPFSTGVVKDGTALSQALRDPAIVEHYVRHGSSNGSLAPVPDTAAAAAALQVMAKLPPDPCVVKVVSARGTVLSVLPPPSVSVAGVESVARSSAVEAVATAEGEGQQQRQEDEEQSTELVCNAPSADATKVLPPSGAGTAVPPKQSISEEDAQLSRRGLRFEAAPWRPSGHFTFDMDETGLANVGAVSTPILPLSSSTRHLATTTATKTAMSRFPSSFPVFAAPSLATSVNATVTTAAAAATAAVAEAAALATATPAVTITSTLAKGGEESTAAEPSTAPQDQASQQQQQPTMEVLTPSPSPTPPFLQNRNAAAATATTAAMENACRGQDGPSKPTQSTTAVHRPPSLPAESPGSSAVQSPLQLPHDSSPLGESVGSHSRSTPSSAVMVGAGNVGGTALAGRATVTRVSSPASATAVDGATTLWGTTAATTTVHSSSPSPSVMREDDGDISSETPLLMSPALDPAAATSATSVQSAASTGNNTDSAGVAERPATAPAVRRCPMMTVTNTATGARMSSSSLTTPSGSPMGMWTVVDGVSRMCVNSTASNNNNSGSNSMAAGTATGALTPSWTNGNRGQHVYPTAVRSAGSAEYGMREFPAMPFTSSFANAAAAGHPCPHPSYHQQPQPQQQPHGYQSQSTVHGSGDGGGSSISHNSTELSSGGIAVDTTAPAATTAAMSPTASGGLHGSPVGAGASHSGGSSYLGSSQLSMSQFPRNNSTVSTTTTTTAAGGGGGGGGAYTPATVLTSGSSLLLLQAPQSSGRFGVSPPVQGESDLDRVRHNRVAVSDVVAKNEMTLVDTLFADAEVDVIEDDESEMDLDDGRGGSGNNTSGGEWWPAYPMGTSPRAGVHSPDAYNHPCIKQQQQVQQQQEYASSPTVSGVGMTFGGGYWYQPGSGAGPHRHSGGSGSAARPRFSPDHRVHRAFSASCASVASSTMSLLDPKQPSADVGASAYEVGEDEEEWEMNSSAYADSLDEAQIQWIEEQLRATENPEGYF